MKTLLLAAVLVCASRPALAQEEPFRSDLFFGPSYLHAEGESLYGGAVAYTRYFNRSFGVVLDLSLHVGSREGLDLRELNLSVGPRFAFNRSGSARFFAQALFGLRRDTTSFTVLDVTVSEGESRFGMAAGGGVDVRLSTRWGLRLAGDYLYSRSEGETLDGFRVSAGAVYRFGGSRPPPQP
jgi:opacity protein-like surface antigen